MHIKTLSTGIAFGLASLFSASCIVTSKAQEAQHVKYAYQHPTGRQFIPRGFVFNTEDLVGNVHYTKADYLRAARLGANFQVIRLDMARLGAWPGYSVDEAYLKELDRMVALAKEFDISTGFKLTVYRVKGFGEQHWTELWLNTNGAQDSLIAGWTRLWNRYRDEDYVYSYDLLNEPHKGMTGQSYDEVQGRFLLPLYRRMIDSLHAIDKKKWALYQPFLMEWNPDRAKRKIPFWELKENIHRDRVMFAPHIYQLDTAEIRPTIDRYTSEAAYSNATLFLGEWGSATYDETDSEVMEQQRYARAYMRTATIVDSLGLGTVKAWFLGSRWKGTNHIGRFTWSIFSDSVAVGQTERKYITDVIARPFPSFIAGKLHHFNYDFARRVLTLNFNQSRNHGESEIYVGANRHYPDGFSVSVNNGQWVAFYDPIEGNRLKVLKSVAGDKINVVWDERLQKLVIKQLPLDRSDYKIVISPGSIEQER